MCADSGISPAALRLAGLQERSAGASPLHLT